MTIKEIKKFASELADNSPKTQIEIVRLCKKLVLGLYEYLDIDELLELIQEINSLIENKQNKLYMHNISIDDTNASFSFSILTTSNEPITNITDLKTIINNIYGEFNIIGGASGNYYGNHNELIFDILLTPQYNKIHGNYRPNEYTYNLTIELNEETIETFEDVVKAVI